MGCYYLFLVEGETEEKLVKLFYIGNVQKFNLWCDKKINVITRVNKNTCVYVIADTDQMDPKKKENFLKNFHKLGKHFKKRTFLLQQSRNLEDELLYCFGINRKELYKLFNNASGNQQLKTHFLKESNLLSKLISNGFDINKLWSRPIHNDLKELESYQKKASDLSNIFRPNLIKITPDSKIPCPNSPK